jgi:NADH-quinone oxidoreductase subunit M
MIELLQHYLLTVLIFLPTVGAAAILIVRHPAVIRWIALGTALGVFLLSLMGAIPAVYDWRSAGVYGYGDSGGIVQLVQRADWIPSIGAQYLVGLDALSLPLVILTALLFSLACAAAWKVERPMGFFTLILLLETMVLGAFLSLDFVLFFVFATLIIPLIFFLLGWWGQSRRAAATKMYLLWGLISTLALLIVMLDAHHRLGSWDMIRLAGRYPGGWAAGALFATAFLAMGSRMPVVPFHFWAEPTYAEASVPTQIVLAGAVANVGSYGLFRIAWAFFPHAASSLRVLIVLCGLITVVYGAAAALSQRNLKRMIADLVIGQMGLIILAMATGTQAGISAAMFLMVAQGLVTSSLFIVAGNLESRAGHAEISHYGGVGAEMPGFSGLSLVVFLAALGLPGLCLFPGDLLALIGSFSAGRGAWAHFGWRLAGILCCAALLLTTATSLGAFAKIFFGAPRQARTPSAELDQRELSLLVALVVFIVGLGILPWVFFFALTQQTAAALLAAFF